MKTVATWNRKGGTGKSTTAGNVAAELRHYGRTLLVDSDPQANLTAWLCGDKAVHELADVLTGSVALSDAVVNVREGLDVLPSFAIGGDLREFAETKLHGKPFIFADLREQMDKAGYSFVIFDLAPGDSTLERSVLGVSDYVILVVLPEIFSRDGMESAEDTLSTVRRDRRAGFDASRLVINRVNHAYAAHEIITDSLAKSDYKRYVIGQSTAIHDCQMVHQTLFEFAPGNKNVTEYQRIATELL